MKYLLYLKDIVLFEEKMVSYISITVNFIHINSKNTSIQTLTGLLTSEEREYHGYLTESLKVGCLFHQEEK